MTRSKSAWLAAAVLAAAPAVAHAEVQAQPKAQPVQVPVDPAKAAPPPLLVPPPPPIVAPPPSPTPPPSSTALASKADFPQCDGYGAPTSSGDGMTEYAMTLGIFNLPGNGTTELQATTKGRAGVEVCNRALANVPEKFWMRRISILRSRAMHALEFGDAKSALADLEEADRIAAGHNDPYYDRSLGLGVKFVRAYALRHLGDTGRAETLALAAAEARPLNRMTALLALISLGPDAKPEEKLALKRAYARYQPTRLDSLYQEALLDGRYDDAKGLYPQLVPKTEPGDMRWPDERRWQNAEVNRAIGEVFWASRGAEYAYLLAARGAPDQGREALAAAHKRIDAALADPPELPPPPSGGPDGKYKKAQARRVLTINTNLRLKEAVTKTFATWDRLVDLRLKVAAGQGEAVAKDIEANPPEPNWATVELVGALAKALPARQAALEAASHRLHDKLVSYYKDVPADGIGMMWTTLPEPETAKRAPPMRPAGDLWFGKNLEKEVDYHQESEGYRAFQRELGGPIILRYRGMEGTGLMTEEVALLRATELALQNNHKGFVIVGRRDNRWNNVQTWYGTPERSDPAGFECELDIVFVDPSALAAPYAAAPWRVVDADAVIAALRPIYGVYTPPHS